MFRRKQGIFRRIRQRTLLKVPRNGKGVCKMMPGNPPRNLHRTLKEAAKELWTGSQKKRLIEFKEGFGRRRRR